MLARKLGCSEASVATEEENTPARALYRKTGGEEAPESIVMYTHLPVRSALTAQLATEFSHHFGEFIDMFRSGTPVGKRRTENGAFAQL